MNYEEDDFLMLDNEESTKGSSGEDEEEGGAQFSGENTSIYGLGDFARVKWKELRKEDYVKYNFQNLEIAFKFYNWYARVNGFSARKDRVEKKRGVVVRQTFLCSREGEPKLRVEGYKREPKRIIRCGCKALCRVHFNSDTQRWHVKEVVDEHNHVMLSERFHGMLFGYRRMEDAGITQMNKMRQVGISTPSIYQAFANQSGVCERVGFSVRDMYNEICRQRKNKKMMLRHFVI
ncbi:FAR1 DNA-binding domain [Sesbania bispinosa]|nr:FAR1 DNA-binding domain [Sesbania bispinosa]